MAAAVACGRVGQISCAARLVRGLLGQDAAQREAAAKTQSEKRKACLSFMPCLRVNHAAAAAASAGPAAIVSVRSSDGSLYRISRMRFPRCTLPLAHLLWRCALCCSVLPVRPAAQLPCTADKPRCRRQSRADKPAADKPAADKNALPPLPPEAHAQQSMELDGKTLKYTVTVGALPVRDKDGKVAGEVVVTSYTMEGENRPVTFALNGGPGASCVYLNFGAIGPKHLQVGQRRRQSLRSRRC